MNGIMPRGTRQLLLPASNKFIWASIFAALVLDMLENFYIGGWIAWLPDFLAVTIVFWNIHQPHRIGMTVAFCFGLMVDVHQAAVLGQHALCYSLLSYAAISLHRRILWFKTLSQALQLLPLFAAAHLLELALRLMLGHPWPDWKFIFAPLIEALLWPIVSFLLLIPQRRSPDPDANRPL